MTRSTLIRHSISLALALGLLGWLFASDMVRVAREQLQALSGLLIATLLLTQVSSYLCRAGRLYSQLEPRVPLGLAGYLRLTLLHNLSINVLPFRAGELLLPAVLKQQGLSLKEAIGTLLWLRIQDALVLALLAILLWPGLPHELRGLAGIGFLLFLALGHHYLPSWQPRNVHLARLCEIARPVVDASATSWSWCLANWGSKLLGLGIVLAALAGLPFADALPGALGGELSALLPVQGVAGFGTYEAGVALLVTLVGGQAQTGLAAAFTLHCLTLAMAILAGSAAWFLIPGPPPASPSESRP